MWFLVLEPPDINYSWLKAGPIRIDAGEGQPRKVRAPFRRHRRVRRRHGCTLESWTGFCSSPLETPHSNGLDRKKTERNDIQSPFPGAMLNSRHVDGRAACRDPAPHSG